MTKFYTQIANFSGNPVEIEDGFPTALAAAQAIAKEILEDIHELYIEDNFYQSPDGDQPSTDQLVINAIILAKKALDNIGAEQICKEQNLWATIVEA